MIPIMLFVIFLYAAGIITMKSSEIIGHVMTVPLRMAVVILPIYIYGPTVEAIAGGTAIASLLTFEYEFIHKKLSLVLILLTLLA